MILGGRNDSGIIDTRLTAHSNKSALGVTNTSVGPALGATGRPIAAGGRIASSGHGPALTVNGVATFSRGGVVEWPTGSPASVIDIAVPGGLTASSYVLATLQNPTRTTGNFVQQITAAEPLVTTGKVRIHLLGTPALPSGVTLKIAWFVCG
jgi:hypothetical protein